MVITQDPNLSHWNYFLALESDLLNLSRFVELSEDNLETYSIEMAHLLLTAASEVDVVLKQLCERVEPQESAKDINGYRSIIRKHFPKLEDTEVQLLRFGLRSKPWLSWKSDRTPDWWSDHNKVKHQRGQYFQKANLQNAFNAMGGLFLVLIEFYRGQVGARLVPAPTLFNVAKEIVERAHSTDGQTGLYYDS